MASCYNCGGNDLGLLYRAPAFDAALAPTAPEFDLARCSACGMVCTTGADRAAVDRAYTTQYYGSPSRKFMGGIERALARFKVLQARSILSRWQRGMPARRAPSVLDIGCGRGLLLGAFEALGATVLGLERREFPLQETGGTVVRTGSLDDPEHAGRRFDIIILWHVLEHMERQDALLDSVTDHLNDGGLLVIAVPNFASLQQRLFGRHWFHLDLPRHLVHLEANWLEASLLRRHYDLEIIRHADALQNVYGFIQSALNMLAPRHINAYYHLLKHGLARDSGYVLSLLTWTALAAPLLPLALLENLVAAAARRGATVQFTARRAAGR